MRLLQEAHFNNQFDWTLTKTNQGTATGNWDITATKTQRTPNPSIGIFADGIKVDGFMAITNTGSGPATIGNIVVNLQKRATSGAKSDSLTTWVSASADVADATNGDAATTAKIVPQASSENKSSFSENTASGKLEFTDADSNTVFSLVPQISIPAGGTINLLYTATFNNADAHLNLAPGAQVRIETIVTFGNAGARGGSGAVAQKVDINGNGVVDSPDELYVRSVPTRTSLQLGPLTTCKNTVTLTDTAANVSFTGTVTFANFATNIGETSPGAGDGTGIEVLSELGTTSRFVSVVADGGTDGGTLCNEAKLHSDTGFLSITGLDVIGTQTITNPDGTTSEVPVYNVFQFPCCDGVKLAASDCFNLGGNNPPPPAGDICTFTQGGWGAPANGNNVGALLAANFATVYPGGFVEIGIPSVGGFSAKFTSALAIHNYLPAKQQGQTNKPDAFNQDLTNPTSTHAGVFGGQVLALQLNVDFSNAGIKPHGLGDLILHGTGTSLDGSTVSQILAAANTALGGGALPAGFTISGLNDLVDSLNNAFDECNAGAFSTHLSNP